MTTRVVIADDHPVVREGMAAMINRRSDLQVVGEAANGLEAIDLYRREQPDILLIDLRMPEMGGVDAIRILRGEFPQARIIVLTTYDGDEDIYRALQAGAMAYLLKDTPREAVLEAIRAVAGGQKRIPSEIASRLVERLNNPALSERELDVLRLIAAGRSNREIGTALYISEGTVKVHVNSILSKLGVSDRTQAVTTALQRGILHLE